MSNTTQETPIVELATAEDLESWLDAHHEEIDGVWVKLAKSGTGNEWLRFDDALNVALCFGMVNGLRREFDREHYLQKFIPREDGSHWTWSECDRAEWLGEQGKLRPAGEAQVEAAKSDGRWEQAQAAYRPVKPPTLFAARLASYPEAKEFYESLDDRNRKAIRASMRPTFDPDADRRHIDTIVEKLRNREKPY